MKKIIAFLILSVVMVSCYDDYVLDYDFNGVYFPNPVNVRTVVVGEGLKIRVGAELAGVMKNTIDRDVNFVIDNNLVTPAVLKDMQDHSWSSISLPANNVKALLPLPSDYFTLSDPGKIIIKKGWHSGYVTLKVDSAKFLAEAAGTINPVYAVPFHITTADADTILKSLSSTVIGLRYENMLFGNYLHGGITTIKNADGTTKETIEYPTAVNQATIEIMQLTTVAPNALVTNGYSRTRSNKPEIKISLNGNNITVESASGSSNTFESDGTSAFNGSKLLQGRKIFLNYKFTEGELTYHCQDTLTFRNRIRDGVNEWQDENPDNY